MVYTHNGTLLGLQKEGNPDMGHMTIQTNGEGIILSEIKTVTKR